MKKVIKKIFNNVEFKLYEKDVKKVEEIEKKVDEAADLYFKSGHETSEFRWFLDYLKESKIKILTDLEYERLSKGLSRAELSKKSGVSIRTIEAYEQKLRNERTMPLDIYRKLYKAMGHQFIEID